jgi:hypothetical protein
MDVHSSGITPPISTDISPFTSTTSRSTPHSHNHTLHNTSFKAHLHAWTATIVHPTYAPNPPPQQQSPPDPPNPHHQHQTAIAITFGVLGCLAMAIFAFGLFRCCYSYKKTPQPDRIAALLNRHHLQTEMDEIARRAGRKPSRGPPPPPYVPKPPEYESVVDPASNV